jgi:hypothetical protein
MEYGPNPQDESIVGDLFEQYQRGRGRIWYWRQILAIVFVGLLQEVRRNKRAFFSGLVKVWCWRWGVHFPIIYILMEGYRKAHPSAPGMTVNIFPLLTVEGGSEILWRPTIICVILSLLMLFLTGHIAAAYSQAHSRRIALAYLTLFVGGVIASMLGHSVLIFYEPGTAGMLVPDVVALLAAPPLVLLGASTMKWKRQAKTAS